MADDKTLEYDETNFDPYADVRAAQQQQAAWQEHWNSLDYDGQESIKTQALATAGALSAAWDKSLRAERVKASEVGAFVSARPDINAALAAGEIAPREVARLVKAARAGGRASMPGQPSARVRPNPAGVEAARRKLESGSQTGRDDDPAVLALVGELIRGIR
jgi:hypothetical protein